MTDIFTVSKYLKLASKVRWMRSVIKKLELSVSAVPKYQLIVTSESENVEPFVFCRYYGSKMDVVSEVKRIKELIEKRKCDYSDAEEIKRGLYGSSYYVDRFWFKLVEIPDSVPKYSNEDDEDDFSDFDLTRNKLLKIREDTRVLMP